MNWKFWVIAWIPLGEVYLKGKWLVIAIYIKKFLTWKMIFRYQAIHRQILASGFFGPLTPLFDWLINRKPY